MQAVREQRSELLPLELLLAVDDGAAQLLRERLGGLSVSLRRIWITILPIGLERRRGDEDGRDAGGIQGVHR